VHHSPVLHDFQPKREISNEQFVIAAKTVAGERLHQGRGLNYHSTGVGVKRRSEDKILILDRDRLEIAINLLCAFDDLAIGGNGLVSSADTDNRFVRAKLIDLALKFAGTVPEVVTIAKCDVSSS